MDTAVPPAPFVAFSAGHLVSLALIALFAAGVALTVRRGLSPRRSAVLRLSLAGTLLVSAVVEQAWAFQQGDHSWRVWPLHFCDLGRMLAIVAALTLSSRVVELLYFFGLTGTVFAALTPELPSGFPSARFLNYFALHGLVILSSVVLTFGFGRVPARGGWVRAAILLNAYAAVMIPTNLAFGANFLYLVAKPAPGTPLDWLGPWPVYVLAMDACFVAAFYLLDLPLRHMRPSMVAPPRHLLTLR